ncbi:MAG TPA: hypothetical protein VFU14_10210 [Acidimicrobiales bacterium]|nr:hypothetical protein [Acidimicrobiales bacterium]
MPEPADETRPDRLSPVPFVVALIGFVVVAVLAFVFLRADDSGVLVRPDRLTVAGDDVIRAVALGQPDCARVERAQVDLAEDAVFVELVLAEGECAGTTDVVAEITLPEPVGDRRLVSGVGRLRLPCSGEGSGVTCGPAR